MTCPELTHALHLAANGESARAVALLEASAEPDARYALGLWRLEGRHLPRDLDQARALIAEAEHGGSLLAARGLSALVAWPEAIALLDRWADRDPIAARQRDLIAAMPLDCDGNPAVAPVPEPVRESPWIARIPIFLSPAETAFLGDLAAARFKPALAFDRAQARFVAHPHRDATVAAFPLVLEWPVIRALNRRIAAASGTDVAQGEPLQVLRYAPGQQYRPHLDAVPGLANQRILTMLVALDTGYDGGETAFPATGLAWRGRAGEALLFRNVGPDGCPDRASVHAGQPVTRGTKHIASRWIRAAPPPPGEAFGAHEVLPSGAMSRQ